MVRDKHSTTELPQINRNEAKKPAFPAGQM